MSDLKTLGEQLPEECARVRGLIKIYSEIPTGRFAIMLMDEALRRADKAIIEQDLVGMISAFQDLKEFKE